jgi:hypothetical protein
VIDRRTFLAVGAGLVVTACGSSKEDAASASRPTAVGGSSTNSSPTDFVVVKRYPNTSLTPGSVRLPISRASSDGRLLSDGPQTLTATVRDAGGGELQKLSAERHGEDMLQVYWPFVAEIAEAGIYYLDVEGAIGDPSAFQVFDPAAVKVPGEGVALAAFETPTTDDPRGVDPLCTRTPDVCPFHEVTLAAALGSGKPVVYLVGTPAHCQTGTCAPGLEYLVELAPEHEGRAVFVHAEVYADDAATTVAPAVRASGLDYEPAIFVTDATGTVVERIDIIWDGRELSALLKTALS